MTQYAILTGVPMPLAKATAAKSEYPVASLEVGQSFFIPNAKKRSVQQSIRNWNRKFKEEGKEFICDDFTREVDQGNSAPDVGVMVWRTK